MVPAMYLVYGTLRRLGRRYFETAKLHTKFPAACPAQHSTLQMQDKNPSIDNPPPSPSEAGSLQACSLFGRSSCSLLKVACSFIYIIHS